MSQYTVQIDQLLINHLKPEIDRLNKSLASMEKMGYSNKAIKDTRIKLNKILPVYDFLYEYVHGKEELDLSILKVLINNVGLSLTTDRSNELIIQSSRGSADLNRAYGNDEIIRVYKDGEILLDDFIAQDFDNSTFMVYGGQDIDKIEVNVIRSGAPPELYTGIRHVVISNIALIGTEKLVLEVKTYKQNQIITEKVMQYEIYFNNCSSRGKPVYWVGTTSDRMGIPNDRHISSIITNQPAIDWGWVESNFDLQNRFIFDVNLSQKLYIQPSDVHALIIVPIDDVDITSISEIVFEQVIPMEYGVHYYDVDLQDNDGNNYKCYYLRDLTSESFTGNRIIQFNITAI